MSEAAVLRNGEPGQWAARAGGLAFETRPFYAGDYRAAKSRETFHTENPATRSPLASFPDCAAEDVDAAASAARAAFRSWRRVAPARRKALLAGFAAGIRAAKPELALLDCLEMGMPISLALQQVDDSADFLAYYAELADKIFGEVAPADPRSALVMTYREPRGVVGVISPWNYPLATAIAAIAPALAAGNTVVAKPSELAPSSVLKLGEIAAGSGLPPGVLNVMPGRGPTAGAALARHGGVDTLHFTGSAAVGRQLLVYSGRSNGKPVMVEGGGKSPQVVFEDAAGLAGLGESLARSAFTNSGQVCVARSRLIVHENVRERVVDAIRTATAACFTTGSPLLPEVDFGPIAGRRQYERVSDYLALARHEGAEVESLVTSGSVPAGGFFLQPSLVVNAGSAMRVTREEIFGPVLTVQGFTTDDEAVRLANDVEFGLAATAWTTDLGRARRLARDLDAGRVDIRTAATSGAALETFSAEPFGGSGHGVLGGLRGLDPYLRLKGVQIITG